MSGHTPGPRRLYFFVHHDGSVTETDALHADAAYVRADIADEMLAALEAVAPHLNVWNEGYMPASDGYWTGDVPADVENAVGRAIAKAKGETE